MANGWRELPLGHGIFKKGSGGGSSSASGGRSGIVDVGVPASGVGGSEEEPPLISPNYVSAAGRPAFAFSSAEDEEARRGSARAAGAATAAEAEGHPAPHPPCPALF